jgi:hypothetical protein
MRIVVLALALAAGALLLAAGQVAAQTSGQDSVRGTVTVSDGVIETVVGFDASSGPSGEDPGGTVAGLVQGTVLVGRVTCLSVTDNRAVVGLEVELSGFDTYFVVVDGGATGVDEFGARPSDGPATDCAHVTGVPTSPVVSGNIVVIDSKPVPTSKDQCKNSGWRTYGTTFRNQGECVAFVQRDPNG